MTTHLIAPPPKDSVVEIGPITFRLHAGVVGVKCFWRFLGNEVPAGQDGLLLGQLPEAYWPADGVIHTRLTGGTFDGLGVLLITGSGQVVARSSAGPITADTGINIDSFTYVAK